MTRWTRRAALMAFLALPAIAILPSVAQELTAPITTQTVDAEGFRPLFNGKDMTGWGNKGKGATIEEGGVIFLDKSGDIWTNDQYGNFVLDLEFKTAKDSNSGVFIRNPKPGDWYGGIEVQVLDSFGKEKPDNRDAGSVYDVVAPTKNMVKAPGEWNRMQITAAGPKLVVSLNGEPVVDMDLDRWTQAGKNPDGSNNKFKTAYKDMPRVGHIELQDHGQQIWYRNIRIKEIK